MTKLPRHLLGVAVLGVAACASSPFGPSAAPAAQFGLEFQNLVAIDKANGHYEAWAVSKGVPKSVGKFLIGSDGKPTDLEGAAKTAWSATVYPSEVTEVYVTQELPGDADDKPSRQQFLLGSLKSGKATLEAPIKAADLASKTGAYLLDNPITEKVLNDYNGIWYSRFIDGKYVPGLTLDESPDGWRYAGWVLFNGHVLRTGKFTHPMEMDDWYGYSGFNSVSLPVNFPGPPMPGEDFNTNAPSGLTFGNNQPDLAGAQVVITLESATLSNEEVYPSPIHLFEATVASPSAQKVNYDLTNVAATKVPSAAFTVK